MNPYRQILEHWGLDQQMNQTIEEMAELTIALNKWRRAPEDKKPDLRTIAEEIADVEIMLKQMKIAFGCDYLIDFIIDEKLERTMQRIGKR